MAKPDNVREVAVDYVSPVAPSLRLTYSDYCEIPPGQQRYELIGGALRVVPSPSVVHQEIAKRLYRALVEWIEDRGLGKVYFAPLDVVLSEHDVVQPDLLYVSKDRIEIVKAAHILGPPDLVVEVLSPGTVGWDRGIKRQTYGRFGIRELWLADPESRSIEVATLTSGDLPTAGVYGPGSALISPILPGFSLSVDIVFP
ncbi:MAG: Uma2 family endonuclease [Firmicutes bacterium]|nr:Uma2 family endonuclease [Bacillota bacterium]MDH7496396.1 Uma2 family endonuclease [Bacillota bacterium]